MKIAHLLFACLLFSCTITDTATTAADTLTPVEFEKDSWQYFLQHLPTSEGSVVDYRGNRVYNAEKAFALVNYDVGTKDLQQCADALLRLRAEYLFAQNRFNEIKFHFTSGDLFSYNDYCQGLRPIVDGNKVQFATLAAATSFDHYSLRKYLDILFTYAGTISLANELRSTSSLGVGTIVVKPGSPGHCFMIVDEATTVEGKKLYKLVEGYTPAQSIYVLKNPENKSEWHTIEEGRYIQTASYNFTSYKMGVFE